MTNSPKLIAIYSLFTTTVLYSGLHSDTATAITYHQTTIDYHRAQEEDITEDRNTIIVTGSMIRGIGASAGTKPIAITQEDILRSGYATANQAIQTLPQNFTGGYSEFNRNSSESGFNFTGSSSPNLRGLGYKATLVLINGRRIPAIGNDTTAIDISSIPISLIDRIEVLPDGASAVYGADAVAGVINVILKKKFDGAETAGRFGHTTEGGLRELNLSQTFGTSWSSGSLFIGYEYFDRTNLYHTDRKYTRSDDLTPFGGADRRWYWGPPANILNPTTFLPDFAIPDIQSRQPLLPSDLLPPEQANLAGLTDGTDIYPENRRHSVFLHARQEISPDLLIFLEGRFGDRDTKLQGGYDTKILTVSKDYPFYIDAYGDGRNLMVAYSFKRELPPITALTSVKSYNVTGGAEYNLSEKLQLRTHGSFSRDTTSTQNENLTLSALIYEAMRFTDPARVYNIFGNGDDNHPETLAYILTDRFYKTRFSLYEAQSLLEGEAVQLPGGDVRFALGGSYRKEKAWTDSNLTGFIEKQIHRDVWSAFGELFLPLVSEQNRMALAESLTVSISGRLDSYRDRPRLPTGQPTSKQTSFTPKFGTSWELFPGYRLRGTYGKSFAVPSLANRITSTTTSVVAADDPRSPTGRSLVMFINGTAPDLKNEKATNWSLGVTIAPPQVPSLRLDATFYSIKFKNRISSVPTPTDFLSREEEYGSIFIRNPTVDQVLAICEISEKTGSLHGCDTPEVVQILIDSRIQNLSRYIVRGIDLEAGYTFSIGNLGQLSLYGNASYLIDHKTRILPNSTTASNLNTVGMPVDFRSRFSATWLSGPISLTTFVNYTDSYRNPISMLKPRVGSWTTVDVTLSYNFEDSSSRFLRGLVLNLSCVNILNNDPPFVDTISGFDAANASPLGRFASVSLTKRW